MSGRKHTRPIKPDGASSGKATRKRELELRRKFEAAGVDQDVIERHLWEELALDEELDGDDLYPRAA